MKHAGDESQIPPRGTWCLRGQTLHLFDRRFQYACGLPTGLMSRNERVANEEEYRTAPRCEQCEEERIRVASDILRGIERRGPPTQWTIR